MAWLAICVIAIGLMTRYIDPVFAVLTRVAVAIMQMLGLQVTMPVLQPDAFPFWDSCMMVLSIAAMILMTRKYVEKLAPVGDHQRDQCGDFCFAGRLCDVAGISDPDIYRRER